jgi:murein L,D-transpeptidase YcbB/YkuD
VPDFTAASTPDALAEAEIKLTASMLDYARQAQSGRMHWSQISGDVSYPEHPIDPAEVLAKISTAKDASVRTRRLQSSAQGLSATSRRSSPNCAATATWTGAARSLMARR